MSIFGGKPYPKENKEEVEKLLEELYQIGQRDDFLSERPGYPFNNQCRHIRAREIGQRLDAIGGFDLMEYATNRVKKKLGVTLSSHLEFAWSEIGRWML
jgi:hypothetical protein